MNEISDLRRPGVVADGPGPAEFSDSPLARALRQPMLLGLFLPLQAGGWSASTLPRGTTWTYDYNARLTQTAEALGFDLVFALSQWLKKGGFGPVRNDHALDSFVTMAALAGATKDIILISTLHVLYGPWHPLHLAKFGATLDHITGGRWGVNIVTGHRAHEHEMFGWPRIEHDRRYELADEFITVVKRLWRETENFSYEGRSPWRLSDAFVTPKPLFGRPILVNATGSDRGIDFAGQHSDIVFITSPAGSDIESAASSLPAHTARVKHSAIARGRALRTLLNPLVICRETEREAQDYADAIVAHADTATMQGFARTDSDAHAWRNHKDGRARSIGGAIGGNVQIIGSPEQVVDQFSRLHRAGVDGLQVAFYDFEPDLAFFGARVLPLMRQAGLRL